MCLGKNLWPITKGNRLKTGVLGLKRQAINLHTTTHGIRSSIMQDWGLNAICLLMKQHEPQSTEYQIGKILSMWIMDWADIKIRDQNLRPGIVATEIYSPLISGWKQRELLPKEFLCEYRDTWERYAPTSCDMLDASPEYAVDRIPDEPETHTWENGYLY